MAVNTRTGGRDGGAEERIGVAAGRLFHLTMVVNLSLVIVHLVGQWLRFNGEQHFGRQFTAHDLFDMNNEVSVPTWWQQLLLASAAAVCLLIAAVEKPRTRPDGRYWTALAVIFGFMSVDEGSEIHERLTPPVRAALDIEGGIFWYAWLIPAIVSVLGLTLVFLNFWKRLDGGPRRLLALGWVAFLVGVILFEAVGGAHDSRRGQDFAYSTLVAAEEGAEMLGASLFLMASLIALRGDHPARRIEILIR